MALLRTPINVLNAIKDRLRRNNIDVDSNSSIVRALLLAVADTINYYFKETADKLEKADPSKASGADLDRWARVFGVTRRDNLYAVDMTLENVSLRATRPIGELLDTVGSTEIRIPPGLSLYTVSGSVFLTLDELVFTPTNYSAYTRVVSVVISDVDNIPPHSFIRTDLARHVPLYESISDFLVPDNEKAINIIHDYDTDDDLRAKIFNRFVAAAGGNRSSIIAAVLELPGVAGAEVIDLPESPHLFTLYVVPKTAQLTIALRDVIKEKLESIIPAGTAYTLRFPTYIPVKVELIWHQRPTDTISEVELKASVADYVNSLRRGDNLSPDSLQSFITTISNNADISINGLYYGIFDDTFVAHSFTPTSRPRTLGSKELFYCVSDLVEIVYT